MTGLRVTDDMMTRVGQCIAQVAEDEILTRWRKLSADQVREKKPGDLVTEADEAAETRLISELTTLFPGSIAFGEETVARDPGAAEALQGDDPIWVMDPVDGTAAFASGHPRFTTIVTLIQSRQVLAAWVQAPALSIKAHAAQGMGAWIDGALVGLEGGRSLWDAVALVGSMGYIPGMSRTAYRALTLRVGAAIASIGIGADYLDVLAGKADIAVFGTRNPWELPAGVLLMREAGGVVLDGLGQDADPFGAVERPLIASGSRAQAEAVLAAVGVVTPEAV